MKRVGPVHRMVREESSEHRRKVWAMGMLLRSRTWTRQASIAGSSQTSSYLQQSQDYLQQSQEKQLPTYALFRCSPAPMDGGERAWDRSRALGPGDLPCE